MNQELTPKTGVERAHWALPPVGLDDFDKLHIVESFKPDYVRLTADTKDRLYSVVATLTPVKGAQLADPAKYHLEVEFQGGPKHPDSGACMATSKDDYDFSGILMRAGMDRLWLDGNILSDVLFPEH